MKTYVGLFILLGSLHGVAAASQTQAASLSVAELLDSKRPVTIAHRGCWEFGPENSLKAIEACRGIGIDIAECDVRSTQDGILVIMHDDTLDRTTSLSGRLKDYTFKELATARLRRGSGGKASPLTTERIPTLAGVLRATSPRLFLLLHVKENNYDQIYRQVEALGATRRVMFLIEDSPPSQALRNATFIGKIAFMPVIEQCGVSGVYRGCYSAKDIRLGQPESDYGALHPTAYFPASPDFPGVTDESLLEEMSEGSRDREIKLLSAEYDPNLQDAKNRWATFIKMNISMIFTNDHASELVKYLKSVGLR